MVVFVCSACGQSMKKNQVQKHYMQQCRNCNLLTCMDCNKEFWGDEYETHTKCITEDEKYGGKDFKPKPSSNKGEVKQEMWIVHLKNAVATTPCVPRVKSTVQQLLNYTNIPRKKAKFENFVRNSVKLHDPKLIDQVWEIFSKSQASTATDTKQASGENTQLNSSAGNFNGIINSDQNVTGNIKDNCLEKRKNTEAVSENEVAQHIETNSGHKKKKTKYDYDAALNTMDEPVEDDGNSQAKFKWRKAIVEVLEESPEKSLTMKKFTKKMKRKYKLFIGESEEFQNEEFVRKLEKKMERCKRVKILEEHIKLME